MEIRYEPIQTESFDFNSHRFSSGSFFLLFSLNGHCLTDGFYKLTVKRSGKALTVKGGSTADAQNVVQYTYSGAEHQKWYIEKTSDTNPKPT